VRVSVVVGIPAWLSSGFVVELDITTKVFSLLFGF